MSSDTQPTRARGSRRPAPEGMEDASTRSSNRFAMLLEHPLSTYYLLGGSTLLLLALGLIMVLSASSIESYRIFDSSYTIALRQAMFAAIGVVVMAIFSRRPKQFWRAFAWPVLLTAFGLLVLVLVVGVEVAGQRNWIETFGPFRLQPSEIAKFALVLWGADWLARVEYPDSWRRLLIPVVPVGLAMMGLVLLEGDFGNALMIAAIMSGILFSAGAPLRFFAAFGAASLLGVWMLTLTAPYRMARFTSWIDQDADPLGVAWQVTQGQYALGTGGFWGVGLGASREKWGSLPEAHTDFIFSVIGEELGLIGTVAVVTLLAIQAFAIFRIARTSHDQFARLAAAGVGSWIVVQSILNIGGVLGLLPITGVPLPLVSYGGSSLIPTLAAIGMLLSFARDEPAARRALRRRSTAQARRDR